MSSLYHSTPTVTEYGVPFEIRGGTCARWFRVWDEALAFAKTKRVGTHSFKIREVPVDAAA